MTKSYRRVQNCCTAC